MNNVIKVGLAPKGGLARWVVIGPDFVDVSALTLTDVATSLGRIPRFGGHTPFPYSVARHCVILTDWLHGRGHRGDVLREAMLHDAPEALGVNDIQHFVKREYGAELKKLETRIMAAVYRKFVGPVPPWLIDPIVEAADKRLGAVEATYFGWAPDGFEQERADPWMDLEFRANRLALDDAAEWLDRWEAIS